MMTGQILKKITQLIAGLVFISVLLIPQIKIKYNFPSFQLIDFLLPIIFGILYIRRKEITYNKLYTIIGVFSIYILFTIFYNGRLNQYRDYFEIYKLIKFLCVILLFSLIGTSDFFKFWIKPTFIVLVIGNLLHYFNVLNFNYIIEHYYNGGVHIKTFGLNSLGLPTYKRMLGFAGNPNTNAIIFMFFSILFFPKNNTISKSIWWFLVALFMHFLCQSRTNLIAFSGIFLFSLVLIKSTYIHKLKLVSLILITFFLSFLLFSNTYLNTLFNTNIIENNSLMGRFETWEYLWEMIKEKPFFGYAPYKEYFYTNNIYSESEYVLQTWRYGFIGLILYLTLLIIPFLLGLKNKNKKYSEAIVFIAILIAINSLTNNPFSERVIMVLFAITIGLFFNRNNNIKQIDL